MPELITDGENGFLVDSVETAVRAVSTVQTIDRRDCRRRVETYFTADRMVEAYIEV